MLHVFSPAVLPVSSPAVTIPVSNTINVPQGQDLGYPLVDSGNAGIPLSTVQPLHNSEIQNSNESTET